MHCQVAHKEQLAAVAMAAREVALKNGRSDHERIAALEQQSQLLQAQLRTAEQHCDDLRDQVGCTDSTNSTNNMLLSYASSLCYSITTVDCEMHTILMSWCCLLLITLVCTAARSTTVTLTGRMAMHFITVRSLSTVTHCPTYSNTITLHVLRTLNTTALAAGQRAGSAQHSSSSACS
jgi:hypothetical protein